MGLASHFLSCPLLDVCASFKMFVSTFDLYLYLVDLSSKPEDEKPLKVAYNQGEPNPISNQPLSLKPVPSTVEMIEGNLSLFPDF